MPFPPISPHGHDNPSCTASFAVAGRFREINATPRRMRNREGHGLVIGLSHCRALPAQLGPELVSPVHTVVVVEHPDDLLFEYSFIRWPDGCLGATQRSAKEEFITGMAA